MATMTKTVETKIKLEETKHFHLAVRGPVPSTSFSQINTPTAGATNFHALQTYANMLSGFTPSRFIVPAAASSLKETLAPPIATTTCAQQLVHSALHPILNFPVPIRIRSTP